MANRGSDGHGAVITTTNQEIAGGGRHRIARRVIETVIDEALDRAQAQPEQRIRIDQVRDRALRQIDAYLDQRDPGLCCLVESELRLEAQRCFLGGRIDPAAPRALRFRREHKRLVQGIVGSVREIRDILTPAQHRAVAEYVRANLVTPGLN
jgi:hypothetical protein